MTLRPDAGELLEVARQHLLDELLPALPPHLRYQTLMIANAMAISSREFRTGGAAQAEEITLLNEQSGQALLTPEEARHFLASAIRTGEYDAHDAKRQSLADALKQMTLSQLSISNPKVLP